MRNVLPIKRLVALFLLCLGNVARSAVEVGPNVRANSREVCPDGTETEQVEPTIDVHRDTVLVSYGDHRGQRCPVIDGEPRYQLRGWAYSLDSGSSFTDGGPLPDGPALGGDPWLASLSNGTFFLAGLDPTQPHGFSVEMGRRHGQGIRWSNALVFRDPHANVDKDAIAVDPQSEVLYAVFRYGSPDGFRPPAVWLIRRSPGSESFDGPFLVANDDETGIATGAFPLVGSEGEVYVAWKTGTSHDPVNQIRVAVSRDQGESFEPYVTVGQACTFLIDGSLSNALFPEFAIDRSSNHRHHNLYLAWQTACPENNQTLGDIVLSRSTDGGKHWSQTQTVNDDHSISAHWFPTVTVDGSGRVNVFFYDRRDNPDKTWTHVYMAQSVDGGRSFQANVRITDVPSFFDGQDYGDYISSASQGPNISFVTWTDARDGDPDIYVAHIISRE